MYKTNEFEVVSGKIIVSDPCYTPDVVCTEKLIAKNGIWNIHVNTGSGRCDSLIAVHELTSLHNALHWGIKSNDIGVDSGQCGIYDLKHFRDDNVVPTDWFDDVPPNNIICSDKKWYSMNCAITLTNRFGCVPYGCVSSSGWGDGVYNLFVVRDENDECVGIKINFIDITQ